MNLKRTSKRSNSFVLEVGCWFKNYISQQEWWKPFLTFPHPSQDISRAHLSEVFKMATKTKTSANLVDQFVSVTGATKAIAKSLLEACNGNLEMAVEMHLDSCENPQSHEPTSSNSSTHGSTASGCTSR